MKAIKTSQSLTLGTSSTPVPVEVVAKATRKTRKPKHPLCGTFERVKVEGKKGKKLVLHPTANWPFETVPPDYSYRKFAPLTKRDFKGEAGFFDYLSAMLIEKASIMKAKADEARSFGSTEDRKAAKKLARLEEQTAQLIAKLGNKVDVAKIIANAKAKALAV